MSFIEEKLAKSLTANTTELIPFLPYLLQDIWELGSNPEDKIDLIKTHIQWHTNLRVLDLACGKGAVSIKLAKVLGCHVKGIDIMNDFIVFARKKAIEFNVKDLCEFITEDITLSVEKENSYDLVIFGDAGEVLGNPGDTIARLKKNIKQRGYMIIDYAYKLENAVCDYPSYDQWLDIFQQTDVQLIDSITADNNYLLKTNIKNNNFIIRRVNELKIQLPEMANIFDGYIDSQLKECNEFINNAAGVSWLLRTK